MSGLDRGIRVHTYTTILANNNIYFRDGPGLRQFTLALHGMLRAWNYAYHAFRGNSDLACRLKRLIFAYISSLKNIGFKIAIIHNSSRHPDRLRHASASRRFVVVCFRVVIFWTFNLPVCNCFGFSDILRYHIRFPECTNVVSIRCLISRSGFRLFILDDWLFFLMAVALSGMS